VLVVMQEKTRLYRVDSQSGPKIYDRELCTHDIDNRFKLYDIFTQVSQNT